MLEHFDDPTKLVRLIKPVGCSKWPSSEAAGEASTGGVPSGVR
jgi:hypothetical protein